MKHIATQALCTVQAQIGTGTFPHTGIALLLLHSSIQHPPSQEGRTRWQPRQRTIKGKVYKQIILQACKQPSPRPRPERALGEGEGACFLSAFSKCGSAKSGHPWYSTVVFQQLLNTDSDGRASVNVFFGFDYAETLTSFTLLFPFTRGTQWESCVCILHEIGKKKLQKKEGKMPTNAQKLRRQYKKPRQAPENR